MRQVVDYRMDVRRAERPPLNLGAHRVEAAGEGAGVMVTRLPAGPAKRRNAGSARPSSPDPTRSSSSVSNSVASSTFEILPQLDAAEAAKHIRAQRGRAARDHGHVLASGIEVDTADPELRARRSGGVHHAKSQRSDTGDAAVGAALTQAIRVALGLRLACAPHLQRPLPHAPIRSHFQRRQPGRCASCPGR